MKRFLKVLLIIAVLIAITWGSLLNERLPKFDGWRKPERQNIEEFFSPEPIPSINIDDASE